MSEFRVGDAAPLQADDPIMNCDCDSHLLVRIRHSEKLAPTKTSQDRDMLSLKAVLTIAMLCCDRSGTHFNAERVPQAHQPRSSSFQI